MLVSQRDLEYAFFQQESAKELVQDAARNGCEHGRFLPLQPTEIVDLDRIQARLREYEKHPLLQVLDDIRLAKRACAYIVAGCVDKALAERSWACYTRKQLFRVRIHWRAFAASIEVRGEKRGLWNRRGYPLTLAATLGELHRVGC